MKVVKFSLIACLSVFLLAEQSRGQQIPLSSTEKAKYAGLNGAQQEKADHLFFLMIYDRPHNLEGALRIGQRLSAAKNSSSADYRVQFNDAWRKAYLRPSRVNTVPTPPQNPEALPEDDSWGYQNLLGREMTRVFLETGVQDSNTGGFLEQLVPFAGPLGKVFGLSGSVYQYLGGR